MAAEEKRVPLLVCDLDGTVRWGKDELGRFVNTPDDVIIFPEALELLRRWKQDGGRIIGVSNQGGIALGHVSMRTCTETMQRTWQLCDGLFDKIAWCSHHPAATDPEWARCWCRKPSPGLLIEAALELAAKHDEIYPPHMGLMVGDRDEDEQCARTAGFDFVWAKDWRGGALP
jgi:D-glycero-D-manno-heptose 1,7-bisphosphate phosphatase